MDKSNIEYNNLEDSRFYFCKVDAKNCFDSINQEKLLEELEHFISSPEYIYKYILKCCAKANGRVFISKDLVVVTKGKAGIIFF
jgi:retron-type reverse transcriptase